MVTYIVLNGLSDQFSVWPVAQRFSDKTDCSIIPSGELFVKIYLLLG